MGKYSVYQEGQTAKLVWLFFFLNLLIIYLVIWGCAGSSLLYSGFLWFWRARLLFVAVRGLLVVVASLVAKHRLWVVSLIVVACGLSCSKACGILQDQGSNPCALHWQVDS